MRPATPPVFRGPDAAIWTEPYRLLFPFGLLMGLHGIGHWMAFGLGWMESYPIAVHAVVQTRLFMGAYISGFLMTAVPRFSGTGAAKRSEVLVILALLSGLYLALELDAWKWVILLQALWWLSLARFIVVRLAGRAPGAPAPPVEFVWLPFAFVLALGGSVTHFVGLERDIAPFWVLLSKILCEKGFILCVVMGIGGFLGPRLMGSQKQLSPEDLRRTDAHLYAVLPQVAGAIALSVSFALEAAGQVRSASVLAALAAGALMLRSGALVWRPPVLSAFTLSVAVSFWAVLAGVVLPALLPASRTVVVHVLFLGGFSLMTLTVSAMVMLSHGGRGDRIHKSTLLFGGMLAAHVASLSVRLYAAADAERYFVWVAVSAALWLVAAALWISAAARLLFRLPQAGDGHGHHTRGASAAC